MNFKKQFLRHSQNLTLNYSPNNRILHVGGPLGKFSYGINTKLFYCGKTKKFWLSPTKKTKKSVFLLSRILLVQSCLGVTLGYRCQLNLVGIGYSTAVQKENNSDYLILKIGFSHLVKILVPDFVRVSCPKPRTILIKGINLQKVNGFASLVRDLKLPNSYKEKGFYYKDEVSKLKQGKKT